MTTMDEQHADCEKRVIVEVDDVKIMHDVEHGGQYFDGVYCAVFRRESDLVLHVMDHESYPLSRCGDVDYFESKTRGNPQDCTSVCATCRVTQTRLTALSALGW